MRAYPLAFRLTARAFTLSLTNACSPAQPGVAEATADVDAAVLPSSECELVFRAGHGDLYLQYVVNGGLDLRLRAELEQGHGEAPYEPERVCIAVPRATYDAAVAFGGRPMSRSWDFLGAASGEPFWFLPQVAQANVPWLGIAADSGTPPLDERPWSLRLAALSAPPGGQLSLWTSDSFGNPKPLLSTASDLDRMDVIAGSHAHFNWGFTAPGRYDAAFSARGNAAGTTVEVEGTFRFEVLP